MAKPVRAHARPSVSAPGKVPVAATARRIKIGTRTNANEVFGRTNEKYLYRRKNAEWGRLFLGIVFAKQLFE